MKKILVTQSSMPSLEEYVEEIKDYNVIVSGEKIQISHPKHKQFLHALNSYLRSSAGRSL